jgi:hypothetical protein
MLIASDMIRYAMASARPKRFRDARESSYMTQLLIAMNRVQMFQSVPVMQHVASDIESNQCRLRVIISEMQWL